MLPFWAYLDVKLAVARALRVRHMAQIEACELSDFFTKLSRYDGEPQTRHAIEFVIQTFVRTNELQFRKWSEIDGEVWPIPGSRMKMGCDQIVPLARQSLAILAKLKAIADDSEWIVLRGRSGEPISENTLLFGMYRLGYYGHNDAWIQRLGITCPE